MDRRSNSKFKEKEQGFFCKPCNYWNDRSSDFSRHVLTFKHEQLYNLNHVTSVPDSDEPSPVHVGPVSHETL